MGHVPWQLHCHSQQSESYAMGSSILTYSSAIYSDHTNGSSSMVPNVWQKFRYSHTNGSISEVPQPSHGLQVYMSSKETNKCYYSTYTFQHQSNDSKIRRGSQTTSKSIAISKVPAIKHILWPISVDSPNLDNSTADFGQPSATYPTVCPVPFNSPAYLLANTICVHKLGRHPHTQHTLPY